MPNRNIMALHDPNPHIAESRPGELARTGERIGRFGKMLDAVPAGLTAPFSAFDGWVNSFMPGWVRSGLSKIGVVSPTLTEKLGTFAPVALLPAAITAAGAGFKVLGAVSEGEGKKAARLTVRGATEAAVVVVDGLTLGIGEIASLAATGKFLSTQAGDLAEGAMKYIGFDSPAPTNQIARAEGAQLADGLNGKIIQPNMGTPAPIQPITDQGHAAYLSAARAAQPQEMIFNKNS